MSSECDKPLLLPLFAPSVANDRNWFRLDQIAEVIDCPHSTPVLVEDEAAPFVVRSQDMRSGSFVVEQAGRVSEETYRARNARAEPRFGDLLYSREGTYFGIAAEVPRGVRVCLGQRMVLIRPNAVLVDHRFLRHWLNSPQVFGHIHGFRDGTVAERLNLPTIRGLAVALPQIRDQQLIGEVLGTLDDRIALLRETNATLEAIAQALFKSWFVDFDPVHAKACGESPHGMDDATAALFPDSFEESELGMIPKGWRVGVLANLCNRIESGGTPKRTVAEYWNGSISWLTSGEVRNPIVFGTKEQISELGLKDSSAKLWPAGTTVIAMYGATAGEVCLIARPSTANQACCGLIAKSATRTFTFICARREQDALASKSSGSAQQNLNKGLIENHAIILPSEELFSAYENIAGAMLDSWIANEQQAQTLAQLRDTLLPKLISGRLRLPEAEALLAEELP